MRRFFIRPEQIAGDTILLSGVEAHHLRTVLRLRPGRMIELLDGTGTIYQADIQESASDSIRVQITRRYTETIHDPFPVTLAQSILKGKKMDVVVQKATELGVATLVPVMSRYCEPGRNLEHRGERWQRIMTEACKQSGRAVPMHIGPIVSLDELSVADYRYPVCCWEKEEQALLEPGYLSIPGSVLLLIGPEGGFHEQEMEWVCGNPFQIITLGPLILRAETAALAAVSIVKYLGGLYPGRRG